MINFGKHNLKCRTPSPCITLFFVLGKVMLSLFCLEECRPRRYTVFDWIQKHLRYRDLAKSFVDTRFFAQPTQQPHEIYHRKTLLCAEKHFFTRLGLGLVQEYFCKYTRSLALGTKSAGQRSLVTKNT